MTLRTLTAAALAGLAAMAAAGCGGASPASHGAPPQNTAPATGAPGATAPAAGAAGAARATGATGATAPGARPSAAGTSAAGSTKCVNSPSAMVGKALGLAVGKVVASAEGPVTVCAYTGRYEVLVRYQAGENPRQFSLDRRSVSRLHQSVTAVGGLGDEAFFASLRAAGSPSYTLAARKNNTAIFITSPAKLGPERALMVQLLEKT